jgi:hypothetical protein
MGLLAILAKGNDFVLGTTWSRWHEAPAALDVVMGRQPLPEDDRELWNWVRQANHRRLTQPTSF